MFATYLAPTEEVLNARRVRAVRLYRELPHTLLDGTPIVPSVRVARNIIEGWKKGLTFPTVVTEGDYRTVADIEAERAEMKARFELFCKEDGITLKDGLAYTLNSCECGCGKTVRRYYAPNAMAYPTWVLGGDCKDDPFASSFE